MGGGEPPSMKGVMVLWLALACAVGAEEVVLFNGKDLQGWTTWLRGHGREDPERVFSVEAGLLRISGEGFGYLATEKRWRDYRLVVEWRWGEGAGDASRRGKARDSGIFLHGTGPDGNSHDGKGAFMAAIEVNLFEGASGDFLLIRGDDESGKLIAPRVAYEAGEEEDGDGFRWWSRGGGLAELERWGRVNWCWKSKEWKDVAGFRGGRDVEKAAGEWNVTEVVCDGGVIEVRMNGALVNRAERAWPAEGRILLQCEGSEIFFRKVGLEALEKR